MHTSLHCGFSVHFQTWAVSKASPSDVWTYMATASPSGNQVMAEASELGGRTVQTSPGTASFPVARPYANGTIIPNNKPRDRLHPEPSPCLGTAPQEALNKNNNILTGTPEHAIKKSFCLTLGGKIVGGN